MPFLEIEEEDSDVRDFVTQPMLRQDSKKLGCTLFTRPHFNNLAYERKKREQKPKKKWVGRWSLEEEQAFERAVGLFGGDWTKVEDFVETRSTNQILNYARKTYPDFFLTEKTEEVTVRK